MIESGTSWIKHVLRVDCDDFDNLIEAIHRSACRVHSNQYDVMLHCVGIYDYVLQASCGCIAPQQDEDAA